MQRGWGSDGDTVRLIPPARTPSLNVLAAIGKRATCQTCAAVGRGVPPAYDEISSRRTTAALHRPSMAPATVSEMWCWPR